MNSTFRTTSATLTLIIIALFVLFPTQEAWAFKINYSALRFLRYPQLFTSSLSNAPVSDFTFSATPVENVLSGSSSATTSSNDIVYNTYSSGTVEKSCLTNIFNGGHTPIYSSPTPSIATINSSGVVTYVSDGTAYFNAKVGSRTKAISCTMLHTNSSTSVFGNYTSTSLAQHASTSVSSRVSGLTPSSTTYDIYSATNDSTNTYTRNTSMFAYNVDLTSIPAYTSSAGTQTMGVLVAKDIVIMANHSHPGPGATIYFVANDNTTVSRTILSGTYITGSGDIYIARLSSDVPSSITPAKVLTSNTFNNKITTTALSYALIPVIFTNQFRTMRIGVLRSSNSSNVTVVAQATTTSAFNSWYSTPIGGDSGSPVFLIVNSQAVLAGVWWSPNSFPTISNYITSINSAITSLGSSYSLSTVDLSGFATY